MNGDGSLIRWRSVGLAPNPSDHNGVEALLHQPDGKIVAGGYSGPRAAGGAFGLARFDPDGTLDGSFGSGGKVRTVLISNNPGSASVLKLLLLPGGKLVAAGFVYDNPSNSNALIALARYNPDGSLDTTFGNGGGTLLTELSSGVDYIADAVLQPDGKVVVAGSAGGFIFLARYNP